MDVKTRIRLAKKIQDGLRALTDDDQDLVLVTCGLAELDVFNFESREQALLSAIRHLSPDGLQKVDQALSAFEDDQSVEQPPTEAHSRARPLELFASHASQDRELVGDTARELSRYGVELFVAHDSIEANAEWMEEIQQSLRSCHGGVAFVSKHFNDSVFCQQEVGWLLGQKKLLLAIMGDTPPLALLSHRQAAKLHRETPARVFADKILAACRQKRSLAGALGESFAAAAMKSRSFKRTDKLFEFFLEQESLSRSQAESLVLAAETNDQVYRADCPLRDCINYRVVVADLVEQSAHRDEFASRIAKLREYAGQRIAIDASE